MLDKRKDDNISLASANLLFKSLNLKIENFLDSPSLKDTNNIKPQQKLEEMKFEVRDHENNTGHFHATKSY